MQPLEALLSEKQDESPKREDSGSPRSHHPASWLLSPGLHRTKRHVNVILTGPLSGS